MIPRLLCRLFGHNFFTTRYENNLGAHAICLRCRKEEGVEIWMPVQPTSWMSDLRDHMQKATDEILAEVRGVRTAQECLQALAKPARPL